MTSKRHYETVAEFIRHYMESLTADTHDNAVRRETLSHVADILSDIYTADNPRFVRQRFIAACGVDEVLSWRIMESFTE